MIQGGNRAIAALRAAGAAMLLVFAPITVAAAQVQTVDPNSAIDADLAPQGGNESPPPVEAPPSPAPSDEYGNSSTSPSAGVAPSTATERAATYQREDVISKAEDVFGRGAEGLAGLIENILRDQGEPNAYIAGREASGAIGVGLRYGSGKLFHKVEGERPIYWTGPSIGFDLGANASKTFVLVYNLYDTQDIYRRFPAGEGNVYVVGGFTASYLRSGNIVVIPIRLGVGWRLGISAGYMKFSEKSRWLPF